MCKSKHTAATYQEKWRYLSVHHGGDVNFPRLRINGKHSVRWPINAYPRDAVRNLLAHFTV